jgi:hypothetical protein
LAKNRRFNYIASSSNANRPFGSGDGTRRLLCYRRFVFASCLNRTSTQITRFFRFCRRLSFSKAPKPTYKRSRAAAPGRSTRQKRKRREKKISKKIGKTSKNFPFFFRLRRVDAKKRFQKSDDFRLKNRTKRADRKSENRRRQERRDVKTDREQIQLRKKPT